MKNLREYLVTPDPDSETQFEPFYQLPPDVLREVAEEAFEAGENRMYWDLRHTGMEEEKPGFDEWFQTEIAEPLNEDSDE